MISNGKYFDRQAEAFFRRNRMLTVMGGHSPIISEVMIKNIQRTPEYIKLKHSIESCKNAIQLKQLSNSIIAYHKAKKEESAELLADYVQKEESLSVE